MNYFRKTLTIHLLFIAFNGFGQNDILKPFDLDFTREAVLIGTGVVAGVTSLIILNNIEPLTLEEINSLNPANVNSFDRGAIGPYEEDHIGDILLYSSYLLPLTFLAHEETNMDILQLTLMYAEMVLIQGSLNGIVKGSVMRTRPFVYDPASPVEEKTTTNARISFFSGHTSMTAALSFFTAKIFTEYIKNNTTKILIWSGAIIVPAATAVMRVNAHWHFLTDVLVGYTVGALVGYLIPELHKSELSDCISIHPSIDINRPALALKVRL